ncbi:uncharacterized protein PITG_20731 [Phytophthora infestans T30-4]|uniref:PD-(D/E)XK endonuclease-like domain-containing protein n=1 Tax=Phytophthora infestans (strain T30-4) TaxID=403677 RepID=D0P2F5_PHYIT|nr:uncharacterized protein PITG_20731 [Phytophthora infestans T30-4]EEY56246.1 conserved hypothetical protein [Phytophthora infestans T30-4]|eukprot:XP_002895522.1 conserved hypothetical protein [Phytophthora infestans T30-4]
MVFILQITLNPGEIGGEPVGEAEHIQSVSQVGSASSLNALNFNASSLPGSASVTHQSLITSVPNLQALQRVRWLLGQPQRRVLFITGSSAPNPPVRAALERDASAFELERRGHGVFGVREFCQLLLRESGRERRVFSRAQLTALLLYNAPEAPGVSRLAGRSTLQRRKGIRDLLQFFRLLEQEGIIPEQYAAVAAASGEQLPQELAEMYRKYQELLMQHDVTSWDGLVMDVLELCGVQKSGLAVQGATAKETSKAVLKDYTDMVVDDVQRMTPAMATLVGHLCGQPSVQSSASFSRVLFDRDECSHTQILEQQLLKTAVSIGRDCSVTRLSLDVEDAITNKRAKMQAFAKQVLAQNVGITTPSPVPLKCWSFVKIVQSFLEETGRLEALLSPSSPKQERESVVLADFLRELESAQNVVKSGQVTFVVPYLQQLRETNLTSSVSLEDATDILSSSASGGHSGIRVLPLTAYALESLAASVSGEEDNQHVLVFMSMRDSKFPGRMKRLTLPLPYELLSEPYPVQTRTEHLEQCEQIAYQALTMGEYSEVIISFAELADPSTSKREVFSRTFQPIWHEGDPPAITKGNVNNKAGTEASDATSPPQPSSLKHSSTCQAILHGEEATEASLVWLSEVAQLVRKLLNRVFLPIFHYEERQAATAKTSSDDGNATYSEQNQDPMSMKKPPAKRPETSSASSVNSHRSPVPAATRASYEPSHLSYSQISEYLRCPHRYYLSRIMKLDGDVSTSMMFGRALHEGIAAFAKSIAAAQRNDEITEEVKTLAAVEAEEAFRGAWAGDGYGLFTSKEEASFVLERAMMALWEFIETHYGDLQLKEIVHVEKDFSFHVPEANVELRGVWDRIDRVFNPIGDGSFSLVIKEFKSNMGGADRNMRKLASDSLQLKMYMYAFTTVFGEAPHGAKLQQIEQATTTTGLCTSPRRQHRKL